MLCKLLGIFGFVYTWNISNINNLVIKLLRFKEGKYSLSVFKFLWTISNKMKRRILVLGYKICRERKSRASEETLSALFCSW